MGETKLKYRFGSQNGSHENLPCHRVATLWICNRSPDYRNQFPWMKYQPQKAKSTKSYSHWAPFPCSAPSLHKFFKLELTIVFQYEYDCQSSLSNTAVCIWSSLQAVDSLLSSSKGRILGFFSFSSQFLVAHYSYNTMYYKYWNRRHFLYTCDQYWFSVRKYDILSDIMLTSLRIISQIMLSSQTLLPQNGLYQNLREAYWMISQTSYPESSQLSEMLTDRISKPFH